MYAIIATGGKQYKVSLGDKVRVEKLEKEVGETVVFDSVLMVSADTVAIGNPAVSGATVEATVTEQGKDKKVVVYKYKPKTGYHKKNGHRQQYTELLIDKIILNGVELKDEKEESAEACEKTEAVAESAEA